MSTGLGVVVAADAAVWAGWSAVVGYAAHRLPVDRLAHDGRLTRIRAAERDGRLYERLRIRRWKDRLPELGAVFPGGVAKRALPTGASADLRRLAVETRRAELVHWAIPAIVPVFAVWNPAVLMAAMGAYAVLANAPCLVVQRYNRARLLRVLAGRDRRGTRRVVAP